MVGITFGFLLLPLRKTLRPAKEPITWRSFVGIKRFRQQHCPEKNFYLTHHIIPKSKLKLAGFYGSGRGWSQVFV